MTKTYKYNSRLITAIAFLVMLLAAITPEAWQSLLPENYWVIIPTITAVLTYLAAQLSEEKRVNVAEQLIIESQADLINQQETNDYNEPLTPLNDVDETDDDNC